MNVEEQKEQFRDVILSCDIGRGKYNFNGCKVTGIENVTGREVTVNFTASIDNEVTIVSFTFGHSKIVYTEDGVFLVKEGKNSKATGRWDGKYRFRIILGESIESLVAELKKAGLEYKITGSVLVRRAAIFYQSAIEG